MLVSHPDELIADFQAIYHADLYSFSPARAAILAHALLKRTDSLVAREIDPNWAWADPVFALIAKALGVEPVKVKERDKALAPALDTTELMARLSMPRK